MSEREQTTKLTQALKDVGVKVESGEDLENYMLDFLKAAGKLPAQKMTENSNPTEVKKKSDLAVEHGASYRQPPQAVKFLGRPWCQRGG